MRLMENEKQKKKKRAQKDILESDPIAPVRIDEELHPGLRRATKKARVGGVTRMVNKIVAEYLEREGLLNEVDTGNKG